MKIVKIRLTQVDQVREFVELTYNCNYDVDLVSDRYTVDAKSLLGIYSLDLSNPLQVVIYGDDSEEYEKALEEACGIAGRFAAGGAADRLRRAGGFGIGGAD